MHQRQIGKFVSNGGSKYVECWSEATSDEILYFAQPSACDISCISNQDHFAAIRCCQMTSDGVNLSRCLIAQNVFRVYTECIIGLLAA